MNYKTTKGINKQVFKALNKCKIKKKKQKTKKHNDQQR